MGCPIIGYGPGIPMTGAAEFIGPGGPILPAPCRFPFDMYLDNEARLSSREQSSSGCIILMPVPWVISETPLDLPSPDEPGVPPEKSAEDGVPYAGKVGAGIPMACAGGVPMAVVTGGPPAGLGIIGGIGGIIGLGGTPGII